MEMIDLRDRNGERTGGVKERALVHRDGDLHGTAHVWLVRYRPDRGSADVLLQKRSADKDSFPGYYDISSAGHIPAGQDFLESAVRELGEELGIKADPGELHYLFSHIGYHEQEFYGKLFKNHEYSRIYLYEYGPESPELKLQKSEVESVLWMDYRECLDGIRNNTLKNCIFQDEYEELAVRVEEYFAGTGRPLACASTAATWAEDAQVELEDWIEEQGIYIRQ